MLQKVAWKLVLSVLWSLLYKWVELNWINLESIIVQIFQDMAASTIVVSPVLSEYGTCCDYYCFRFSVCDLYVFQTKVVDISYWFCSLY